MNGNHTYSPELITAICRELQTLARHEEDSAAAEAAHAPYWQPTPASVVRHRETAAALRADLARLEAGLRAVPLAS